MDGGAWQATVHGVTKPQTQQQLTHIYTVLDYNLKYKINTHESILI